MLKILYAASNNYNASIQLSRFLDAVKNKNYIIKIAAYKKSSPININIDWTLDSLNHLFDESAFSLDNDNLKIYFDQIKYFKPDLIISDMEHYTSYIGHILDIPVWQCSSVLINFALNKKYHFGIYKNYSFALNGANDNRQKIVNIIDNSSKKLIYSHFGDTSVPPDIKENFEWIRPYHKLGKESLICKHNVCAVSYNKNINLLNIINKFDDVVLFSNFIEEKYNNIILKNINNNSEYFCNLKNSQYFVCEGQMSFLADAYYNNKRSFILINSKEKDTLINSMISFKLGLAHNILDETFDVTKSDIVSINNKIKYLHEKIEETFE
jgi:hypothetical protein